VPRLSGLSVVVPAYNAAATVVASVQSALAAGSGLCDFEVVVVDDGSTDGTADIVGAAFPSENVVVVRHRANRGGAAARNTAVQSARHSWLYCLDSDNLLDAASLARIVETAGTGDWDIVAPSETRFFADDPSQPIHQWFWERPDLTIEDVLRTYETPVACGNYLFSLDAWAKAGGYPEFAGSLDAWGFGVRALFEGLRFGVCTGTFYLHRQGHESYYMRDTDDRRALAAAQILLPYISRLTPADRAWLLGDGELLHFFEKLPERPLTIAGGKVAEPAGRVVKGSAMQRADNAPAPKGRRARAAVRRAWAESPPRATVQRLKRPFGSRPAEQDR
jgi:glycosyltransferase involved in cell wall biosynthesis